MTAVAENGWVFYVSFVIMANVSWGAVPFKLSQYERPSQRGMVLRGMRTETRVRGWSETDAAEEGAFGEWASGAEGTSW